MFECPFYIAAIEFFKGLFPKSKKYRIIERENELGYWLEEIGDDSEDDSTE